MERLKSMIEKVMLFAIFTIPESLVNKFLSFLFDKKPVSIKMLGIFVFHNTTKPACFTPLLAFTLFLQNIFQFERLNQCFYPSKHFGVK